MMINLLLVLAFGAPEKLIYAAGYIPNVQFAPFYVAASRGYYAEEGIELEMDYTLGPDVLKLVALGKIHLGSADPDAFLHASVRGLPLVHVATLYQSYPIALIAKDKILTHDSLKGKRIGISGTYGSSYLGLKAILAQLELSLVDVRVASIGFTQASALSQDRVDVVVGYANNEPLRLAQQGIATQTLMLDGSNLIPGVGVMTSQKFKAEHGDRVNGFLRATFRGMHDVVTDPEGSYALLVNEFLPQLKPSDKYKAEYQVLLATLPFWQSAEVKNKGYGQCEVERWERLATQLNKEQKSQDYKEWSKYLDRSFRYQAPVPE